MKKIVAILLLAVLLCGCTARNSAPASAPAPTLAPTPSPTPLPTPEPTPEPVLIGGRSFEAATESVDLAGSTCSASELTAAFAQLPALKEADLHGCPLSTEEKLALTEAFPEVFFGWEVDVLGVAADSADEYICLDNIPMESTEALEALLPLLPRVNKIDMCYCGIDNEEMYQLNQRHEGIRFIWVAPFGSSRQRTDITYFNHNNIGMLSNLDDSRLDVDLRYYPDLVALDLGHCYVNIQRCDWLKYTPKLQYLILADCHITDITPIGELKDLKFLELFVNRPLEDVSALAKLEKLETLNLSSTAVRDVRCLKECKALRYCWLNYCWNLPAEYAEELAAALPDCLVNMTTYGPTSGGWRDLDVYYEMRDAFHAPYMGGNNGGTNILG